ncbi:Oligopeptide transporter 2 [Kluyveromyces marxianus]
MVLIRRLTKFLINRTTSIQSKKKESSTENGNLEEFDGDTPSFRRAIIEACGHNPDDFEGDELPEDIQYMINVITSLPIDDALKILERAVEEHHDDANFSSDLLKKIELLLDRDQYLRTGHNEFEWFEQCKIDAALIHYHSPYPEVTVTSPIDDESIPVETFRAYFFGFFWTILGAGVNEFFSHRKPLISLTAPVMQILLYPCGKFFERVLPNRVFKLGKVSVNFNPGPWSYKEQMFATIIFNVSTNYTYVAHNIYVQKLKVFYGNDWLDFGYEVLLMLCSQLLGFGYADILRKFVIYNEKCLWPTLFPTMALNGALLRPDNKENTNGWRMTSITMGVLTEIIIGYALPGNGLALKTIKSLGYTIDNQAESYIADQKLAHYAKIPQRAVFKGQLVGVLIQCFVALGVINWQIVNVKNICTSKAEIKFTCPKEVNFYSSSVFWGVIGPKRVFNGLYPILKYTFLIGFLLNILCCAIKYFFPKQTRNFHPTILMGGLQQFAPYNLSYVTGGLYISFAFMFYIKRYYTKWWEKYNYVLSAAFSSAIASSAIVIFFAVNYKPKHINWWGNNIIDTGVDGGEGRQTLKNVTSLQGGYFGPRVGSYP